MAAADRGGASTDSPGAWSIIIAALSSVWSRTWAVCGAAACGSAGAQAWACSTACPCLCAAATPLTVVRVWGGRGGQPSTPSCPVVVPAMAVAPSVSAMPLARAGSLKAGNNPLHVHDELCDPLINPLIHHFQ
eukprot:CAMPEP_0202395882 /NCGR_PEP_ID=MMETSP1127-20130417/94204_1 /ASSEMBLY_ACC=CAM_ASM_000462 /TAXON_ID=3047 /ORGANISM="Dunaliella tertiolecta, Strain CCMP1320" /LENGTH=132 /DNA_ID=CAMNT_0048998607 /DNA_START=1327 /DNA_END=1725 /DNA_ORIENTATION=+